MDISEVIEFKETGNFKRHPWEITRRKIVKYLITNHLRTSISHLVDVGCGDGFILQYLLEQNIACRFSAVDIAFSKNILNRLKSLPNSEKVDFCTSIGNVNPAMAVDCVLLLDVLEHIPDDGHFIREIKRSLNLQRDARWIITVPAHGSLFSYHDQLLGHYRRYSLEQLSLLCRNNNLTIIKKGYFFFSLIPVRLLEKIILKFTKNRNKYTVNHWKAGNLLTSVINTTLWLDFKLSLGLSTFHINVPGLSCYCICR